MATPAPQDFSWVKPLPMYPPEPSEQYDAGQMFSVSTVSALFGSLITVCILAVCLAGVIAERKAEKAERQIAAAAELEEMSSNKVHAEKPSFGGAGREVLRGASMRQVMQKKATHKVMSVDGYKVDPTPATVLGGCISVLIWPCVVVYTVIVILAILRSPPEQSNKIEWSMGNGPFPMTIECVAPAGCYVANRFDGRPIELGSPMMGIPERDPGAWDIGGSCVKLARGEELNLTIFYTGVSTDGLSVVVDRSPAAGKGFMIKSQMYMNCMSPPLPGCVDNVIPMPSYIDAGATIGNYVKTDNHTQSGRGRTRHEWFMTKVSPVADGIETHPCYSELPLEGRAEYKTSHIPMAPFWNRIEVVKKQGLWFTIIPSTVGGAYGLLFEIGGVVLAAAAILKAGKEGVWNLRNKYTGGSGESREQML